MATPRDVMQRHCANGTRLSAQPADWDVGVGAQFWRVDDAGLLLRIIVPLEAGRIAPSTPLWCIFESHGRARTFRTVLREEVLKDDGALAGWWVDVPDTLGTEDRRRAFRVPRVVGVQATLHLGNRAWPVPVRNLSVLGALVDLPHAVVDVLPVDATYRVQIETGEGACRIAARFVRRARNGLALQFPGSVRLGEVRPKPELARVVRIAELRWLRKRAGREVA